MKSSPAFAILVGLLACGSATAVEVPVLDGSVNDYAAIMPQASVHELSERLRRFRIETGRTVVVLTLKSLQGGDMESFGRAAFRALPLDEAARGGAVLLVIAVKDRKVGIQTGADLEPLFPEPRASQKLLAQVSLYFDGLRRDLGVYAGVNYIFMAIRGEVRVDGMTELEKLEESSTQGRQAGAILAFLLAPFLALMTGALWGVYAGNFGAERNIRLFLGALLGGGAAKIVETLMSLVAGYGEGLWYFILAVSILLGLFGSLTEFWMSGDWSGIPRVKDRGLSRKPEDKMGI